MAHEHDHDDKPVSDGNGDGELYGVLAEFDTPGELVAAARKVRDAGYTHFDCYSPFPVHGIDEAMGIKRTILPLLIFGGGFTGTLGGILLQWWCNASEWKWNISGKPTWSIPANIPIAFETTILVSVLTAFFGMWILNKLPQVWHPYFRLERFGRATDDAFLLGIEAKDERFDAAATARLLKEAGALEIENCYLETDPKRKSLPKWVTAMIVSSTAFALIPFAIAAKARNSHSTEPHYHIFPDMDFQPKFKPDTASDLFGDSRANRGQLDGTIARGHLKADEVLYYGIETVPGAPAGDEALGGLAGQRRWTQSFPRSLDVTPALMARGQQRYNIYCTPCHGFDGKGTGTVHVRASMSGGGWVQPRDLVKPPDAQGGGNSMLLIPNGQLFNTISNGFQTMQGYAAQIPAADRWAIILYIRAMQRAANSDRNEVSQSDLNRMGVAPEPTAPPAGTPPATPPTPAGSGSGSAAAGSGAAK